MKVIKNIPNIFSKEYIESNADRPVKLFLGVVVAVIGLITLFCIAIPTIYFTMNGFGY